MVGYFATENNIPSGTLFWDVIFCDLVTSTVNTGYIYKTCRAGSGKKK